MEICDHNHEEVCFEGKNCPVCPLVEENEDLKEEIRHLKKEIEDLKKELEYFGVILKDIGK